MQGGRFEIEILKQTPHSLDREDRQDFVRFRDLLPNLFQFQELGSNRYINTDSIRARLLNCSFNEHSPYYALKRTRTSTLFSTRF